MNNSSRKRKGASPPEKSTIPFIGGLRKIELIGIGILFLAAMLYMVSRCSRNETPPAKETTHLQDSIKGNQADERLLAIKRRLYVCIDSLKLRSGPYLDSTLIAQLPFGTELVDMDQSSKFEQTIRISLEYVATEPWVKVRTNEGKTGWVFGAGVRPYRKSNPKLPNTVPEKPEETTTPPTTAPTTPANNQ
jgi:hypothetical protein